MNGTKPMVINLEVNTDDATKTTKEFGEYLKRTIRDNADELDKVQAAMKNLATSTPWTRAEKLLVVFMVIHAGYMALILYAIRGH